MMKNWLAKKKTYPAAWRGRGATTLLLCAMMCVQPAQAQDNLAGAAKSTLNFVDADIESVIAAIGDYTNTTFIIDPRVKGKVNLVSEKPLTKAQAFQLFTSILRMHGYTVVAGNGYSKVVPEADAKVQAGPIQAGTVRGDQIATQVFRLDHASASNLAQVLRPLVSPNNTINAVPGNNTLVITDYAENLLRLGRIIRALDDPASADTNVVPIRYAVASDVAAIVTRLLDQSGTAGMEGGRTSVLAYPRTNSVVVQAPTEARVNMAKALIEKLDQPTAQPGNVHVVYLKNADATKLALTLRAVVSSDVSSLGTAPQGGVAASGGAGGFIQADPATNTLIITASESVYRDLRAVIDQLDTRRAQVYIETLIVEVTAAQAAAFGVQWGALSGDATSRYRAGAITGFASGADNLVSQAAAAATTGNFLPPSNGLSIGVFRQAAGKIGLGALAQMLQTEGNANILSMPNMVTLDNEEAKIIVGQNVPFLTGQYATGASGGAAGVNPFQTIERKDIGLSLRVKPQISQGGTVKMSIYQEISSVLDATGAAGITTNKRSIDTNVLVDDGQIIVLGGLIDEKLQDGVEQVPGLGSIPVIGNLFKYQTRKREKTNLMVFLRPTVVRTNEQSVNLSSDRYNYIRDASINAQPEQTIVLPDMEAPQLPELRDGQMVGGSLFNKIQPGIQPMLPEEPAAAGQPNN